MTGRIFLYLILALTCGGATAATKSFSLTFVDDHLTEFHTKDFEVCFSFDTSCYPEEFDVNELHRSPLAPFAGLKRGDDLLLEISETSTGEATCSFGGLFDCGSGFGYSANANGDFNLFDWFGDVSINADTNNGVLSFFGAAGSYAVNGCTRGGLLGVPMPDGFCDFFGYEAEFVINSDPTIQRSDPIAPVPLPPTMLLMAIGLLPLGWIKRRGFRPQA